MMFPKIWYLSIFILIFQNCKIRAMELKDCYPYAILVRHKNPQIYDQMHAASYLIHAEQQKIVIQAIDNYAKNRSQEWDSEIVLFKNTASGFRYIKSTWAKSQDINVLINKA